LKKVDYIIVGQGIAGTVLAHGLIDRGYNIVIIDKSNDSSASKVSSGIINPITGRRIVKSWMIDELIRKALPTYRKIGERIGAELIRRQSIIRTLHSIKDENLWLSKAQHDIKFTVSETQNEEWNKHISDYLSFGEIKGYRVDVSSLLHKSRIYFNKHYTLADEEFNFDAVYHPPNAVVYGDLQAKKIIFCEGWRVLQNPYFNHLEFEPAKGEALIIRIPNVKAKSILKHKLFVVPLVDDLFWVGATYAWNDLTEVPTQEKKAYLESTLKSFLKEDFEIIEHKAGIRPSTARRRPIAQLHDRHPHLAILNGLGTKGLSLAPFFAKELIKIL